MLRCGRLTRAHPTVGVVRVCPVWWWAVVGQRPVSDPATVVVLREALGTLLLVAFDGTTGRHGQE